MGMLDGLMLGGMEVALYALLVALLALTLGLAVRGAVRLRRSRLQPTLTVEAGVVAMNAGRRVTFEVESGDRIRFRLPGSECRRLSKGDSGRLTFQGGRYLSFETK